MISSVSKLKTQYLHVHMKTETCKSMGVFARNTQDEASRRSAFAKFEPKYVRLFGVKPP